MKKQSLLILWIRSSVFNLTYLLWTLFCCIIFTPLLLFIPRYVQYVGKPWAEGSLFLLRYIAGIKLDIKGREFIPILPSIIASKHQSALDILVMLSHFPRPAFVLKKELLSLPYYGLYLRRMGMIAIDRKRGVQAIKRMLKHALQRVKEGRFIIIFPEGTRINPGERSTYNPGVAILYEKLNIPVVPVAVNTGKHWQKSAYLKTPGTVTIQFLAPIQPGIKRDEFLTLLADRIETTSNQLLTHTS